VISGKKAKKQKKGRRRKRERDQLNGEQASSMGKEEESPSGLKRKGDLLEMLMQGEKRSGGTD